MQESHDPHTRAALDMKPSPTTTSTARAAHERAVEPCSEHHRAEQHSPSPLLEEHEMKWTYLY